ncbi:MAG: class I SAM-dependent methyltransferase, partial [Desulfobulbaceae bacterium]|nr:class I SAM-dependent methyltransferase [Desulfobulbaceae bacterium]
AGCGSGHGLGYLKEELPDIDIFGIEASAECCRILQEEVGATLLGRDINGRWLADNQRRFDLIIMRHVAEHFLTPIESLNRLRGTLANGGLIYIAVPDMMHPRTVLRDYDKWWEYWFRTVHTHYYSKETLFATLAKVGLSPLAWGEDNQEVWCLADTTAPPWPPENNLFTAQSRLLTQLLPTT